MIDANYYPVKEAEVSNKKHRPVGIGVQGLADAFLMLKMPFDSEEARKLNKDIFETIYFGALTASCELAEEEGAYETFKGSPASKGQLQFDLWNVKPSNRWDFDSLKKRIIQKGLRNSLLIALMPTASTSQILGYNECFEPYTTNLYTRRVLSGEFIVVNKLLLKTLIELNLWNDSVKNQILAANGSIQGIAGIPDHVKLLYRTVWELKQKALIDLAADRGPYICQTQSLNLFVESPTFSKLSSMHFYAWKQGLKTGIYYLRTKAASEAIKFTVDVPMATYAPQEEPKACSLNDPSCLSCSG